MTIGNARLFVGGRFVHGSISFENGVITGIGNANAPCDFDAQGNFLVPGFIDIHIHGVLGGDASDGNIEGLCAISRHLAAHGVTSFLPTTMTLPESALSKAMNAIRSFSRPENGAKIAGVNLEGPFLSYAKRGAQNPEYLQKPDFDMLCRLQEKSGGLVRTVTVAPEEDKGFRFIEKAAQICTVSLGHTTAGYETAMEAFSAGASHVTHLYNGMNAFAHRAPGVVGAAFDSGASVELICDGVHIHESVIRATHRLFGKKMVIISDCLSCAGQPDGEYDLGEQPIVIKNGRATLLDGTIAGSSSNLLEEMKIAVSCGIRLEDVITCLTSAPAKAARLFGDIGELSVGKRADMLLLDENLDLRAVYIDGIEIPV